MVVPRKRKYIRRMKKRVAKKRVTKANKKIISAIAQKVVNRTLETKHSNFSATKTLQSFAGSQDNNVISLGPYATFNAILQGTGDGSRVGNRIKIKRSYIKFTIIPFPYSGTTNLVPIPQDVVFIIFYDRQNNTVLPTPTVNNDMFQNNASTTGFTGNLYDVIRDYNEDRYRVLFKKVYKVGFAINQANGADANNAQWSNNEYKLNVLNERIDYTKWIIKDTIFNDNNAIPQSRGLFAMWYSVPCNNSSFGSTQTFAQVIYQTNISYEDA